MTKAAAMLRVMLLLFLMGALGQAQEPVSIVGPLMSREVEPGVIEVRITVQVTRPLEVATVPVISSYLRFVAPMPVPGWLEEDDLLGSLYEVDLNGDGRLAEVEARVRDGELRIDHFPVEPLSQDECGPQSPYRQDGSLRRYTLGPDAPDFMVLFCQPPAIGLELQHRGYDPVVEEAPNPSLQVLVFEPCPGPSSPLDLPGEPNFAVSWPLPDPIDRRLMFNWEPALATQWVRSEWTLLPIANRPGLQELSFRVSRQGDSNPVGVMAQINYSVEPGVRRRTRPVIGRLW